MRTFDSFSGGTQTSVVYLNPSLTAMFQAAQSFTPTITHRIAQVRFKISQGATGVGCVVADVRETVNGLPSFSAALASSYLTTTLNISDVSTSPTWYTFSFPKDNCPKLLAGTPYAICIYPSNESGGIFICGAENGVGGQAFSNNGTSWNLISGYDLYFEEIGYTESNLFFLMG